MPSGPLSLLPSDTDARPKALNPLFDLDYASTQVQMPKTGAFHCKTSVVVLVLEMAMRNWAINNDLRVTNRRCIDPDPNCANEDIEEPVAAGRPASVYLQATHLYAK